MAEKKIVYVVTGGCYSDYCIEAVFDERELADRYCEGSDDSGGYGRRVEEYELNPRADDIRAGLKGHVIELDRDGNVLQHCDGYGLEPHAGRVAYVFDWGTEYKTTRRVYRFKATVIAKSAEQAIKATNEQRARWIADGKEWPADE